jgi:hypothetical protein
MYHEDAFSNSFLGYEKLTVQHRVADHEIESAV